MYKVIPFDSKVMRFSHQDGGYDRIATIDIETTSYDPEDGETVSVGIGVHDCGDPLGEASYSLYHREGDGENAIIKAALDRLEEFDADALVTYNGRGFDFDYLDKRCRIIGATPIDVSLDTPETHIDLFEGRKEHADSIGEKWPGLEECLESYELPTPTTIWEGTEITNTYFGETVGPAYLDALTKGDTARAESITEAIEHYLTTDLEANFALYYADSEQAVQSSLLGDERKF